MIISTINWLQRLFVNHNFRMPEPLKITIKLLKITVYIHVRNFFFFFFSYQFLLRWRWRCYLTTENSANNATCKEQKHIFKQIKNNFCAQIFSGASGQNLPLFTFLFSREVIKEISSFSTNFLEIKLNVIRYSQQLTTSIFLFLIFMLASSQSPQFVKI